MFPYVLLKFKLMLILIFSIYQIKVNIPIRSFFQFIFIEPFQKTIIMLFRLNFRFN